MPVGVLCLQGSSEPHLERLRELDAAPVEVRQKRDLAGLTHLILPGGESTTIRHLLDLFGLTEEITQRFQAGELALFGTCAGAILLGQNDGSRPERLALLDATLTRNAFGRQVDSFAAEFPIDGVADSFHGVFIRAPRFVAVGPSLRVLARLRESGEPILVEAPGLLAGIFHPELTRDLRVHRYFLALKPLPSARGTPAAGGLHPQKTDSLNSAV